MFTLIEIFDSKQYENIISPVSLDNISKIIYIGTESTMTKDKVRNTRNFFTKINYGVPLEFHFVERDNTNSVISVLEKLIESNKNCILDVTGGEDVLLVCTGIVAQRHSLPLIRTDAKSGQFSVICASADNLKTKKTALDVSDFITLQGGKIRSSEYIKGFSADDSADLKKLFLVNSADCEAYSIFCNFVSEFVSVGRNTIIFKENEINNKNIHLKKAITNTLGLLCKYSLLEKQSSDSGFISYRIKSRIIAVCLKKSGNLLEYYTSLALTQCRDIFRDICVGTTIEWNDNNTNSETQNEIDVLAVSGNTPVFISCKNGDVKKEALYELDTVSRNLGGSYAKKILVCTHISFNHASRTHFIKRAKDMGIRLIYDSHKTSYEEFIHYLRNSVK